MIGHLPHNAKTGRAASCQTLAASETGCALKAVDCPNQQDFSENKSEQCRNAKTQAICCGI